MNERALRVWVRSRVAFLGPNRPSARRPPRGPLSTAGACALLAAVLLTALPPESIRAEPVGHHAASLELPARFAHGFGDGWRARFTERLAIDAEHRALSRFALSITLQSIGLDQLPADPTEAAAFCAAVALQADIALRGGRSPTRLAADIRQVARVGGAPAFGPGLDRGRREVANQPIFRGPFSVPGPARPGPRSGHGGDGPDDSGARLGPR